MRIIAGRYKGTKLTAVGKGDPVSHLRPTTDRVRENLFNVLGNYLDWDGKVVLDLFAGTGALGLEALSRGAKHTTFVENGRAGQKIISDNIHTLDVKSDTRLLRCSAEKLPQGTVVDVIFMDPPYGKSLGEQALISAQQQGWVASNALIIWEESSSKSANGFDVLDCRRYGDSWVTLLEPKVL